MEACAGGRLRGSPGQEGSRCPPRVIFVVGLAFVAGGLLLLGGAASESLQT